MKRSLPRWCLQMLPRSAITKQDNLSCKFRGVVKLLQVLSLQFIYQDSISLIQQQMLQTSAAFLIKQGLEFPKQLEQGISEDIIKKFQGNLKFFKEEVFDVQPDTNIFEEVSIYNPFKTEKLTRNSQAKCWQSELHKFFGNTFNLRKKALGDVYTIVDKQGDEIKGALSFIVFKIDNNIIVYIFQQKTADQHSRQGVGKMLINKIKQYAVLLKNRKTYREVYLLVSASQSLQPCSFYEKQGFVFATAMNDLKLLQLQQLGAVLMIYPWPIQGHKKRKPSTPTDILRQQIHELNSKCQELESKFLMTDAELQEIKELSLKRQKASSVGACSIKTNEINQHYNLNYTNNILQVNIQLKEYLKHNTKYILPNFKPFGLDNPSIYCFFLASLQEWQHINFMLTRTLLIKNKPESTTKLYQEILGESLPQQQQDAQECLMKICEKSCQHLVSMLAIKTHKEINCLQCGHKVSSQQEVQTQLQLPMKASLELSFEQYFSLQNLTDYRCDSCSSSECQEQCFLDEVNEIFMINFMRFNKMNQKDNTYVFIPDVLMIKGSEFELMGFVPHIGTNLQSGHYVKCYKTNSKWMIANDNNIFELTDSSLRSQSYMCCFKRADGTQLRALKLNELDADENHIQRFDDLSQCSRCNVGAYNKKCQVCDHVKNEKQQDYFQGKKVLKFSKKNKKLFQKVLRKRNFDASFELLSQTESQNSKEVLRQNLRKSKAQLGKQQRSEQMNLVVKFLLSGIQIGAQITDFAETFDDKVKYFNEPSPLELIYPSKPFCDGFKMKCYKELFPTKEDLKLFLKQFLNVKQLKYANTNQYNIKNYYWVRLNDDDAFINEKLCQQFLIMLEALKNRLIDYYNSIGLQKEEVQKKLQQEIPINQIDDTFDVKGFLYLNQFEINAPKIAQSIGYELNQTIKSTKTSLQFAKYNDKLLLQKRKLYNKTLQQIQSESVSKRVTNGLKLLAFASHSSYQRVCQAQQTGMSRSECCNIFSSYQELETFLKQPNIAQSITDAHQKLLQVINSDDKILLLLNGNMSFDEAITVFFGNIKRTVFIFTDYVVCLIYGYNKQSRKYYGVLQNRPFGKNIEEFVKRYAVPFRFCDVYELNNKSKYKRTTFYKISPILQLPFKSLCDKHTKQLNYGFFDNNDSLEFKLAYNVVPSNVEITFVSSTHNFSQKELKNRNKKLLCKINSRYSKHSAQIQEFQELGDSNIHLITFDKSQAQLIIYDNTKNNKFKLPFNNYQFDFITKELLTDGFVQSGTKLICVNGKATNELKTLIRDCLSIDESTKKTEVNQIKLKRQRKCQQQQHLKNQATGHIRPGIASLIKSEVHQSSSSNSSVQVAQIQNNIVKPQDSLTCFGKKEHPRVEFKSHIFRYKGKLKDGFYYECLYQKFDCNAYLKVDPNYIPIQLVRNHKLEKHV